MSSARQTAVQAQMKNSRASWGEGLTRFCGYALLVSSMVKFIHPSKAVAYMASMGFEGGTFFVVAVLELISAILFLVPATRRAGLLLVSLHGRSHRGAPGGASLLYRRAVSRLYGDASLRRRPGSQRGFGGGMGGNVAA